MESLYPSIDLIKEALHYEDGVLFWKARPVHHFSNIRAMNVFNSRFPGKVAGTFLGPKNLYRIVWISIKGQKYQILEHIVVWAIHNNRYPDADIDHSDGDGLNNKIYNLNEKTRCQNMQNKALYKNNKSGRSGVQWYSKYSKWVVKGSYNNVRFHLGYYDTIEAAISAREDWEIGKDFTERHGK